MAGTNDQLVLWPDGENIPDDEVRRVFRWPPNVPKIFQRSTLVVGSKGAGKTTLLKYQKATHSGVAIHISLATILSSLSKQSARGPLSGPGGASEELQLIFKATSLLAITLATLLSRERVEIPVEYLVDCLPRGAISGKPQNGTEWFADCASRISRAALADFDSLAATKPLVAFTEQLARRCQRDRGRLLILLDRADLVTPAALVPVLDLLDQSPGFIALVATRPGHGGTTLTRLQATAGAGDQYEILPLGLNPRAGEWTDFVIDAVEAQLGEGATAATGEILRQQILALSRDSIRTALELFQRFQELPKNGVREAADAIITDIQERQLSAIQGLVWSQHHGFRRLLNTIRKRAEVSGHIVGPVALLLDSEDLFGLSPRFSLFIEAALRAGGLCMAAGQWWLPGTTPYSVEIPPLLLWERGDSVWQLNGNVAVTTIRLAEGEAFSIGGGQPATPKIFIAYVMNYSKSKILRDSLQRNLALHPYLGSCEVVDGHTAIGDDWAAVVRERIKKAKLVIADCTRLRIEVMFELGFALGLKIPMLPVVDRLESERIPFWLRGTQFGEYDTPHGMTNILASVEAHLRDPSYNTARQQKPVSPGLVVWFRKLPWTSEAQEECETLAQHEGLRWQLFDENDDFEQLLTRATQAHLLIVSFDGRAGDALAHYICGAIAAKPEVGYGSKRTPRRIVVIEPASAADREFTAEGLSRCGSLVTVTKPAGTRARVKDFAEQVNRWRNELEPPL